MRAQLRTYHAIPSLQARQDPNSYKQLQDAPRLKSILKGASEDRAEPNTIEKLKQMESPRTNPVNLIFVLSQFAPKVTELHFPEDRDFYDLIMRTSLTSKSRATAFLWLMWFYLESDFTEEGADENPFGPGVVYVRALRNQGVPLLVEMTPADEPLENVDTKEELDYGHSKMKERKRIIEADQAAFQTDLGPPKRGPKPKLHLPPDEVATIGGASPASMINRIRPKYESDIDSTRSTPPPKNTNYGLGGMRIQSVLNKGRGSLKVPMVEGSSPITHPSEPVSQMRRPRPLTAHQIAVEKNRNLRVDYILSRGLRKQHHIARKRRKQEGAFFRAMARAAQVNDPLEDSEDEEGLLRDPGPFRERGFIGLVQLETEEDDFGEEVAAYAAGLRRMNRRLLRWDSQKGLKGVMGTNRVMQGFNGQHNGASQDNDETEDEQPRRSAVHTQDGAGRPAREDEDLDDMDKEILGLGSEDDESGADKDLDDIDKALLGLPGGDETEDDEMDMD
jgi:Ino eighty subunit 1